MKKLIPILAFLIGIFVVTDASAPPRPQSTVRIRDNATPGSIADVLQFALTWPATNFGIAAVAGNYVRVGANWIPLGADANGDLTVNQTTATPGYGRIQDGDSLILADVIDDQADGLANTLNGLINTGLTYSYNVDLGTWYRLSSEVADGADITAAQVGIHSFSLSYVWDGGDWKVTGADANGDLTVNQTTTTPGYGRLQDGDSTVLADVIDAHADNLAMTLNGLNTAAFLYGYDGSTMDLLRIGAVGELQATDVATRAGEDAGNDWRKVKKEETGTASPAKTAGTAVDDAGGGTTGDIVLAATEVLSDPNWCITIKNAGGGSGDALTSAILYVSPSAAAGEWESLTWTACDTLASGGGTCSYCCSNCAYRYAKAEALCGAGDDTTVDAFYTANEN